MAKLLDTCPVRLLAFHGTFKEHRRNQMCDHWEKKSQALLGSSVHIYIHQICLDDSETEMIIAHAHYY